MLTSHLALGEIPQWELEIPPLAEVGLQKGVDILIVPWAGTLVDQMGDNPREGPQWVGTLVDQMGDNPLVGPQWAGTLVDQMGDNPREGPQWVGTLVDQMGDNPLVGPQWADNLGLQMGDNPREGPQWADNLGLQMGDTLVRLSLVDTQVHLAAEEDIPVKLDSKLLDHLYCKPITTIDTRAPYIT